jgi:hypothetical protein
LKPFVEAILMQRAPAFASSCRVALCWSLWPEETKRRVKMMILKSVVCLASHSITVVTSSFAHPCYSAPISASRKNRDRFWRVAKIGNPDFPDFCDRRNRIPIIAIFASSQKLGILIFPILASRKNRDSYFCEWLSQ